MSNSVSQDIAAAVTGIIGLAVIAVVVSNGANTANVVKAVGGGLSNLIAVAISPVTGKAPTGTAASLTGGQWALGGTGGTSGLVSASNGGIGIGTPYGSLAISGSTLNQLGSAVGNGASSLFGGSSSGIDSGTWDTGSSILGNSGTWDTAA